MEGTRTRGASLTPACVIAVPHRTVSVLDAFRFSSQYTPFYSYDGHDFILSSELPEFQADSMATTTLHFDRRCAWACISISALLGHSGYPHYNRHFKVDSHARPYTHLSLQESLRIANRKCCRAVARQWKARTGSCLALRSLPVSHAHDNSFEYILSTNHSHSRSRSGRRALFAMSKVSPMT